ncbi:MAG TPA: hypothetical protein VGN98_12865, partial [Tianweitania sediminis]|nr:hypothetical protein [Tianweitania sediminis]
RRDLLARAAAPHCRQHRGMSPCRFVASSATRHPFGHVVRSLLGAYAMVTSFATIRLGNLICEPVYLPT